MIITSDRINLRGSSTYEKSVQESLTIREWTGMTRPNFEGEGLQPLDALNLSEKGKMLAEQMKQLVSELKDERAEFLSEINRRNKTEEDELLAQLSPNERARYLAMTTMLERLTGKKIPFISLSRLENRQATDLVPLLSSGGVVRQGWGREVDYDRTVFEQEKVSFEAQGVIQTADGRTIDFSVSLAMSRTFYESTSLRIREGDALIDPLILNFDSSFPSLTPQKYAFDLDADGILDQISFAGKGSGFLALDKNQDGKINDGSELFGPQTGNGFQELAQYDLDGNGWIDENDPIFQLLKIWTKDETGKDLLIAIGQLGVGAIYLGHTATDYRLLGPDSSLQGQLRQSGIFLKEDGTVSTIHHVDITK